MGVLSAISEVMGGFAQKASAEVSEAQAKQEKKMAELRAQQVIENSRRQLGSVLGTIQAVRASRNVSGDSQTGQQIQRVTRQDALRAEGIARLAELNRAAAAALAQRGYGMQARWAVPMGFMRGLAGMEGQIASAMTGGAGGG
jgi:hypothetical protein